TAAELHSFNPAYLAPGIGYRASDQVADVDRIVLELRPLARRNLYLTADQLFGLADGVHSSKFQYDAALVKPMIFQLHFTAPIFLIESKQPFTFGKALGEIRKQHCCNFALSSLGLGHLRDSDELPLIFHLHPYACGGTSAAALAVPFLILIFMSHGPSSMH